LENNFRDHHHGKLEIKEVENSKKSGLFIVIDPIFSSYRKETNKPKNIQISPDTSENKWEIDIKNSLYSKHNYE